MDIAMKEEECIFKGIYLPPKIHRNLQCSFVEREKKDSREKYSISADFARENRKHTRKKWSEMRA